jgi:acetyltransferase-like isoleucine patch superfamily enzyme
MSQLENKNNIGYSCLEWLWVAGAILIYGSSLILPVRLLIFLNTSYGLYVCFFFVPVGLYIFLAVLMLITGILNKLFPRIQEGTYPLLNRKEVTNWIIHTGIHNYILVPGFYNLIRSNPFLRRLYYKLFGAVIHPSALISYDVSLIDPYLVEIGEGTKIGRWAKLLGHIADEKQFVLGKIKIGKHVLIGGECIIGPGVTIGDGSVVNGRSSVLPFTQIPTGEMWAGTPARFRKKLNSDVEKLCKKENLI